MEKDAFKINFGTIVAPTIKEIFVEKIESMILSGELASGDRLPPERELAESMNISKTAVHDGLKELAYKGFLTVKGRQGTYISNYGENGNFDTLAAILKYNEGKLERGYVRDVLEIRTAVEGQAFILFAHRHSDEDTAALDGKIGEIRRYIAKNEGKIDYSALALLFYEFHHLICVKSKNRMLPLFMSSFKNVSMIFWENSLKIFGLEKSVAMLEEFALCLKEGRGEDALRFLKSGEEYYLDRVFDLQ